MALPTLQPYWVKSFKTPLELSHLRMEKQADLQSRWSNSQKFFKKGEIHAKKDNYWTSEATVRQSMDAVDRLLSNVLEEDRTSSLTSRRAKLLELLTKEKEGYQEEMKKLRTCGVKSLSSMQSRVDKLHSEKEEVRKKNAQQKLYEHWRQNEPSLRELEFEKRKHHVIRSWQDQVDEKDTAFKMAKEDERKYEEKMEIQNKVEIDTARQKAEERKRQRIENAAELQNQIVQLKNKEKEAEIMHAEEEKLVEHERLLHEAEQKRKALEEKRKKHELGRVLIRQYKHQLRKKSKEVQEALENDFCILKDIAEKEKEELEVKSARKEKERADAEYMLKVVAEQLRLEKCREADLDALYQEEASRQWLKRESEWERERHAREKLMKEVLKERQEQINEKKKMLQVQQKESIEERERLINEMEAYQMETYRKDDEQLTERKRREEELKEQISSRESHREKLRREAEEEFERERLERENYEAMLAKEAERLNMEENPPFSSYRRKKRVAFM